MDTPYIFTVLCVTYVLRRNGQKLPTEIARARPVVGWLELGRDPVKCYPETIARLLKNEGTELELVTTLVHAHVRKISRGGLLICGQEVQLGYGAPNFPQAWWVKPGLLDDTTA